MDSSRPSGTTTPNASSGPFEVPKPAYFLERLKELRRQNGLPVSSDEEEPEEVLEEGVVILHKLYFRRVTLHPGGIVMKTGKRIRLQEADALRIAAQANLPVPRVHDAGRSADGKSYIKMDYIHGQTLEKSWPTMTESCKKDIVQQLHDILVTMRSLPPPDLIGGCDGTNIWDTRLYTSHKAASCSDEVGFNAYLLNGLSKQTPPAIYNAFAQRLKTNHRVVFSHCDIAPRNIIVKDGRINGLIDWEDAGWYPEYWEYVKFFQRSAASGGDWQNYAEAIFPQSYPDELVDYIAISAWQS